MAILAGADRPLPEMVVVVVVVELLELPLRFASADNWVGDGEPADKVN
jgi:hypothetical protein